jgi:hypothetical protein
MPGLASSADGTSPEAPFARFGRGKSSIYRGEAPNRGKALRKHPASVASGVSLTFRQQAAAAPGKALRRTCCTKYELASHSSALFVGDSQLEALYDYLCDPTVVRSKARSAPSLHQRCTSRGRTMLTMVVSAGKWARFFPSFYTARITLSLMAPDTQPSLIVTNMASPHLLHVHPVRPFFDADSATRPPCFPQSTCADWRGLLGLDDWITSDIKEFRQRLASVPTIILMTPNWICDAKLYPAYIRRLNMQPTHDRFSACRKWTRTRARADNSTATVHSMTEESLCDDFTFSSRGSEKMAARLGKAARLHNVSMLPAMELTRGLCNQTSDARHYPKRVPLVVDELLRLSMTR